MAYTSIHKFRNQKLAICCCYYYNSKGCGLFSCIQVFYYSTGIFLSAGISPDMVQYANIGTGAVNVIMTGISVRISLLSR